MQMEVIRADPAAGRTGPPLLFIHGAYVGAWCWTPHFLPHFAALGYPCRAISLRGHGGSEGQEMLSAWRVEDYVDDVAGVVAKMAAEYGQPPVLVGHSMGGFVALQYARREPVAGLALLAPVPPEGLMGSALHLLWQQPQLLWELNLLQHGGVPPRLGKLRELLFSDKLPCDELRHYATCFQHESDRAIIDMTMPQFDMRPPLGNPPALVLGSEDDMLMPTHLIHSAARFLEVRARLLRGVGHLMMLDADWQQAADALADWLHSLPGGAACAD